MSSVFDVLPGVEIPVGEISKRLALMWSPPAPEGGVDPPDDATATQVNFVLHLGLPTTPDEAAAQFQAVLRFTKRYPSRIVILCPQSDTEDKGGLEIRAKIYGKCYFGKTKSDKRCVEVVTFHYSQAARGFLENQVSISLSTDLPLYYWAYRFSASSRLADYRFLLSRAERVLIDSATAPEDALTYPWPNLSALRDLAYARLLPVRQTVGQFLAGYAPEAIVGGLQKITVRHGPDFVAEARVISGWLSERIRACTEGTKVDSTGTHFRRSGQGDTQRSILEPTNSSSLTIEFHYDSADKFFRWTGDFASGQAHFAARLADEPTEARLDASVSLLAPELALSEAMFF
ncbi:hypothetical protein AXK12_02570 [Cephaloticoccus capnophilus]|uniref:Glucose-6-phosphate dehydrogenase assembly protein OpcA N-terminal domain-containing protein n=1 Tax=Cephaloticoccus capnophilus TaxID=1548208 RepID=A0A139SQV7_9BACT|nr:glucose-6-phosphate dehydrogenase assembly protein OpcA [Cephaloticoccus capnophilus]KXU36917.1 hypothetical protein AXK12_02570 [Cephaloticoccus capnophilus]